MRGFLLQRLQGSLACAMASVLGMVVAHDGVARARGVEEGEALARQHCGACHVFPEPDLLDRRTWEQHALRKMAPFLGVARLKTEGRPDGRRLEESGLFPPGPVVSQEAWRAITAFYAARAPEVALEPGTPRPVAVVTTQFDPRPLSLPGSVPRTTLATLGARPGEAWIGDAGSGSVHRFDAMGQSMGAWSVGGAPTHVARLGEGWVTTLVGSVFPSDVPLGRVVRLSAQGQATGLLEGLERPVMTVPCDLNGDGLSDLVVNGFGNQLGRLAWHEALPGGTWRAHELLDRPGAVCTEARDLDGDGDLDLLVLMAQSQEQLLWFVNDGRGRFDVRVLLRFHPVFGAVHFETADMDGDGDMDVVLSNGDNGEYPSPFKRYHGVRIFRNDGSMRLVEAWFQPVNGAFKTLARDLDGDGDRDLAVISFFPDYARAPEESFLMLRHEGGLRFRRETVREATLGRWLTMDAGDLDADGDIDLLLGSFCEGPPAVAIPAGLAAGWRTNGVNALLLLNRGRP
ncbi:MAG: FG-GAP-like repeat-containing protein [Verrucomicrobiota bacterium]